MNVIDDKIREEIERLVDFERGLTRAYERQGGTMASTALIVPLTEPNDEHRHVALALEHAIGINVTSPVGGVIRISHGGCDDEDGECILDVLTSDDSSPKAAIQTLVKLMTVTSIIETASEMARDILEPDD